MTALQESLRDREVAITGKLLSMTREQAVERLREIGARYAPVPTEATDWLVVGQGGPPLGRDGHLTRSLQRALALRADGHALELLSEEQLLAHLDLAPSEDVHRLYTTTQVARMLGVPRHTVRAWTRQGLLAPVREVHRLAFFDFAQVSNARALLGLLRQEGVTPVRIQQSLEALRAWMREGDQQLGHLEALERGGRLVVRLQDGRVADPSGQLHLDFGGAAGSGGAAGHGPASGHVSLWFGRGVRAEEAGRLHEAVRCYEQALEEVGPHAEIAFNLGNARYGLRRLEPAAGAYQQAVELEPEYVEAWNNLGNVLAELSRTAEAVAAYRRALGIAPDYADAHFNLAETLVAGGESEGARRHYEAYLARDPHSEWAEAARGRLLELEQGPDPGA